MLTTLLTFSSNNCSYFDTVSQKIQKRENITHNKISFILQSQKKIIRALSRKEINKEQVLHINTMNKYFKYLVEKPLVKELKALKCLLKRKERRYAKTEHTLAIENYFKIHTILENKFSTLLSTQRLILKMATEHPSKKFKKITEYSYLGMSFLNHLFFVYYFGTVISGMILYFMYPAVGVFVLPYYIILAITVPLAWYYSEWLHLSIEYGILAGRYQYDFDKNQTLDEYSYNSTK